MSLELLFLVTCLALSGIVAGIGVPLYRGWVPPNNVYGFRTPQTLRDPQSWYPANRACGYWLIVTGVVTTGIAAGLYAAGIEAPYALFFTLVFLMTGVIVMAVQSEAASRRRAVAKLQTQYRLMALLVLMTLVAIGCAVVRLPIHWALKTGILSAYLVCVVGLLVRNYDGNTPNASLEDVLRDDIL
jgi:uncharacterized membrane protein YiaA